MGEFERANDLPENRIETLVEQARELETEQLEAAVAELSDDINAELEEMAAPSSPEFQQPYDIVKTEARVLRDDRASEFGLSTETETDYGIAREIADGDRELNETVFDHGSLSDPDEETRRVGRKLLRRLAATCKKEICASDGVFELSGKEFAVAITPIIVGALAGTLVLGMFAPLAVLVALFITDVGIELYCNPKRQR